jgi:hypothetical protein
VQVTVILALVAAVQAKFLMKEQMSSHLGWSKQHREEIGMTTNELKKHKKSDPGRCWISLALESLLHLIAMQTLLLFCRHPNANPHFREANERGQT